MDVSCLTFGTKEGKNFTDDSNAKFATISLLVQLPMPQYLTSRAVGVFYDYAKVLQTLRSCLEQKK